MEYEVRGHPYGMMSMSPFKPPPPYISNWKFRVQLHVPPAPTLVYRNCCKYEKGDFEEIERIGPVERCLKHPPLPGEIGSGELELEILDQLMVKDCCNSQVFTVQILEKSPNLENLPPPGTRLVAKVFDPLYYDDAEYYTSPFLAVDGCYTHETRAYQALAKFQGHQIPIYYGSYSLDLPIEQTSNHRTVRLILLEYIPGIDMQKANPADFSQQTRQQIMKDVIDLESLIYWNDIKLRDCSPRNILLRAPNSPGGPMRIMFIDFGHALFNRRRDDPYLAEINLFTGQYVSPLLRWTENSTFKFGDWIDWEWRPWLEAAFAHTLDTITPEMRESYD